MKVFLVDLLNQLCLVIKRVVKLIISSNLTAFISKKYKSLSAWLLGLTGREHVDKSEEKLNSVERFFSSAPVCVVFVLVYRRSVLSFILWNWFSHFLETAFVYYIFLLVHGVCTPSPMFKLCGSCREVNSILVDHSVFSCLWLVREWSWSLFSFLLKGYKVYSTW